MVRHSGTRHGRREGLGIKVGIRPDPQAVLSTIGGHAVGDRLALGGKDVVHGIVRGAGNSEVVVTVIENVGLGVVGVVGGELALEDLDGELLRSPRRKLGGLLVALELDSGLLHTVLTVIVGVGALNVNADGVRTRNGTRIADGHIDGEGVSILNDLEVRISESGVGKSRSKRIGNIGRVVEITRFSLAKDEVFVSGLVVAVTHIDALCVDVVVAPVIAHAVAGRPFVGFRLDVFGLTVGKQGEVRIDTAKVCHNGIETIVLVQGVRHTARGIGLAVKDIDEGRGAEG